jgi:uncharacterized protein DUF1569
MADTPVQTKNVDWRSLGFKSLDDVLGEAERLATAERAGKIRRTGNWTTGQVFGHLSTWMDFPYDGYPPDMKPPWVIRSILKLQKKKFVVGPMPRGVRIPGQKEGTKGTDPLSLDEGLSRLRRSCERMRGTAPTIDNPIFGALTHEEWIAINLRHAELHLGYLHPQ